MIWLSVGAELIIIGLVVAGYFKEKKKEDQEDSWKNGVLRKAGAQIVSMLPNSKIRQEKNQIYQVLCKLIGEEESKTVFLEYRQKRWGLILGVMLLMNTTWLMLMISPDNTEVLFEIRQDRPEYGQGDQSRQVMVILDGEEKTKGTLSLQIPEKEITQQQAEKKVQDGLAYVEKMLDGQGHHG